MPHTYQLGSKLFLTYNQQDIKTFSLAAKDSQAKYSLTPQGTFGLEHTPTRKLELDLLQFNSFMFQGKTCEEWKKLYTDRIGSTTSEYNYSGLLETIIKEEILPSFFAAKKITKTDFELLNLAQAHLKILQRAYQGRSFETPVAILEKIIFPLGCQLKQTTKTDGSNIPDKSIELYYDFDSKPKQWMVKISNKITIDNETSKKSIPFKYNITATLPLDPQATGNAMAGFKLIEMNVETELRIAHAFDCFLDTNQDWKDEPHSIYTLLHPLLQYIGSYKTTDGPEQIQVETATKLKQLLQGSPPEDMDTQELQQPGALRNIARNLGPWLAILHPALYKELNIASPFLQSTIASFVFLNSSSHTIPTTPSPPTTSAVPPPHMPTPPVTTSIATQTDPLLTTATQTVTFPITTHATQTDPPKEDPYLSHLKEQVQRAIMIIPTPDHPISSTSSFSHQSMPSFSNNFIKREEINLGQWLSKPHSGTNDISSAGAHNNGDLVQDFLTGLIFQNKIVNRNNSILDLNHMNATNQPMIYPLIQQQVLGQLQGIIQTDVIPLIASTGSTSSSSSSSTATGGAWAKILEQEKCTKKAQQLSADHLKLLISAYQTRAIHTPITILSEVISCFTNNIIIKPKYKKHLYFCQKQQCWILEIELRLQFFVNGKSSLCFSYPLICHSTEILKPILQQSNSLLQETRLEGKFTPPHLSLEGHEDYIKLFKGYIEWDPRSEQDFVTQATSELKKYQNNVLTRAADSSIADKFKEEHKTPMAKLGVATKLYYLLVEGAANDFNEDEIKSLLDGDLSTRTKELTFLIWLKSPSLYHDLAQLHNNQLVPAYNNP